MTRELDKIDAPLARYSILPITVAITVSARIWVTHHILLGLATYEDRVVNQGRGSAKYSVPAAEVLCM